MTPSASDYQKVRLWSGIFSIGTNLGLIWAFYLISLLISPNLLRHFPASLILIVPVAAWLALGFVFDILVGFAAETALARTRQSFKAWSRDWFVVALRTAPALYIGLLALSWLRFQSWPIFVVFGLGAALLWASCVLFLPLFLPRAWQTRNDQTRHEQTRHTQTREFESQLRRELELIEVPAAPIIWIESEDETTVNGAIAPLGRAQIWLATNVAAQLTARQAALLVRRDFWFRRTRKHLAETAICIVWLLFGLIGARLMPALDAVQGALGGAAWMTSWCFAALFVWPRLNSAWMREADRDLLRVASREEIETLLRRVQELNASDTQLPDAKSNVFHPIPDLSRRLENLK